MLELWRAQWRYNGRLWENYAALPIGLDADEAKARIGKSLDPAVLDSLKVKRVPGTANGVIFCGAPRRSYKWRD